MTSTESTNTNTNNVDASSTTKSIKKSSSASTNNMTSFILGLLYMLLASGALLLFIELPLGPLLRLMQTSMDPKGECKAICTNCTFLVNKVDMIAMRPGANINQNLLQQHGMNIDAVTSKLFELGTKAVCGKEFIIQAENDPPVRNNNIEQTTMHTTSNNNNNNNSCSQLFAFYKESLRLRFHNILTLKYRHKNGSPLLLEHNAQAQLLQQQFDGVFPANVFSHTFTQQTPLERQMGSNNLVNGQNTAILHAKPQHSSKFNVIGNLLGRNSEKQQQQDLLSDDSSASSSLVVENQPNPKVPKHFDFQRSIFGSGLIPNAIEFCSLHCRPAGPATIFEKHVLANIDFLMGNSYAAIVVVYLRNYGRSMCAILVLGSVLIFLLKGRKIIHQQVIDIEETDEKVRKAIPVHRKFLSAVPTTAPTTAESTTTEPNPAREQMIKLHQQQNAKLFATLQSFSDENLDKFINGEFDGAFVNAIIQEGGLVVAPNNKSHHHHHRVNKATPKSSRHATPSHNNKGGGSSSTNKKNISFSGK